MEKTKLLISAEEFLRLSDDGHKYELVNGELRMCPAGLRHEWIGALILGILLAFVRPRRLGYVLGSSVGYKLPSGDVRSPDVSFVAMDKLPDGKIPVGFGEFMPDLAVEVLSPNDKIQDIATKIGEYLAHGVRLLWIVDPDAETVTVYRSLSDVQVFHREDTLTGEAVLPGFTCQVREFFE